MMQVISNPMTTIDRMIKLMRMINSKLFRGQLNSVIHMSSVNSCDGEMVRLTVEVTVFCDAVNAGV